MRGLFRLLSSMFMSAPALDYSHSVEEDSVRRILPLDKWEKVQRCVEDPPEPPSELVALLREPGERRG